MKKIVSLLLCAVLMFSLAISASAASITPEIEPLVNTPCTGGNGKCQMLSCAWGTVRNETTRDVIFYGNSWQCENCNMVIVTEGDPLQGQKILRYAMKYYAAPVGLTGCTMYVSASSVGYCNSNVLEGYTFLYH